MSTYLETIVKTARTNGFEYANAVYMGDDINAIDVAYSETQNHKISIFFVPGEVISKGGDFGGFINTCYFNAYIFVPVEEDVAATVGWETAFNVANSLTSFVVGWGNQYGEISRPTVLGSREFRVGRGYYIYVVNFSIDTLAPQTAATTTIKYYKYTGETNGTATYSVTTIYCSSVEEKFGLSRNVVGIDKTNVCDVVFKRSSRIDCSQKDWFIVSHTAPVYASKAAALAAGYRVYEVRSWEVLSGINSQVLGMKISGV